MEKVGIYQDPDLDMEPGQNYADNGLSILDTSIAGNHNTGHEFSPAYDKSKPYWEQPKGVIGPALNEGERNALIAYLKSL